MINDIPNLIGYQSLLTKLQYEQFNMLFFILFPFIKNSVPSKWLVGYITKENGAASVNQFIAYTGIGTVGWTWSKQDRYANIEMK